MRRKRWLSWRWGVQQILLGLLAWTVIVIFCMLVVVTFTSGGGK